VNDDTQESGHRRRYSRYAVFMLAALLVVSLGFVLIPREPEAPAAPPFTEQARAAALSDAVVLRAAGAGLPSTPDGTAPAVESGEASVALDRALDHAVTLLTVQARALMLPTDPAGFGTPSPVGTSVADGTSAAVSPEVQVPQALTPSELAAALYASGARRVSDAETADGGMARLLAGAGIAQLLAAEELAAVTGTALEPLAGAALPSVGPPSTGPPSAFVPSTGSAFPGSTPTVRCPAPSTGSGAGSDGKDSGGKDSGSGADLASSLTAIRGAELELVYAYQVALTRLTGGSVAPASAFLAQHEELRDDAEAMGSALCAELPPTPAGYVLGQAFLTDPAAALGAMEAGALPAYGDAIALSDGAERAWAVSALQSAARRTIQWGAAPGPVPGLVLDEAELPELPSAGPGQGRVPTSSRTP